MKRNVLVTGASSGIGEAVAKRYIDNNDYVICVDREPISVIGSDNYTYDLSKKDNVASFAGKVKTLFDHIDILINCAGVFMIEQRFPLETLDLSEIIRMMNNNYISVVAVTKSFLGLLKKSENAAIVNISSDQAFFPRINNYAYSASKAAIAHFTKSAAGEFLAYGIRVNSVAPSSVKSGFLDSAFPDIKKREEIFEKQNEIMPLGLITPEEVADVVYFLGEQRTGKITGQTILMDSGLYL